MLYIHRRIHDYIRKIAEDFRHKNVDSSDLFIRIARHHWFYTTYGILVSLKAVKLIRLLYGRNSFVITVPNNATMSMRIRAGFYIYIGQCIYLFIYARMLILSLTPNRLSNVSVHRFIL
jgi:hypothetical protein